MGGVSNMNNTEAIREEEVDVQMFSVRVKWSLGLVMEGGLQTRCMCRGVRCDVWVSIRRGRGCISGGGGQACLRGKVVGGG